MIEIKDLHKSFGDLEVLKGITETIKDGEIVSIIGPSGSGKSTFLRCINLLEEPTSGHIIIDGTEITDPKTDINKVRENLGMVCWKTSPSRRLMSRASRRKKPTKPRANC